MSTVERLTEAVALTGLSAYGVRFSDLVVRYGEVVVLAGPNGSGKSTISRVIVGELAVAGTARVLGLDPVDDAADLKGRIGFLVKDLETMGSLTSRDVIDICAAVRGCGTSYAHELAERLGLDLDRPMAVLSRGQLRRLGIIQALMHKPELVVLDDPMTELDAPAREALPPVLREAAARGAAVLVTAQSPADAESYADRIVPLRTRPAEEPAPLCTPAEQITGPTPTPRRRRSPAPDPARTVAAPDPTPSDPAGRATAEDRRNDDDHDRPAGRAAGCYRQAAAVGQGRDLATDVQGVLRSAELRDAERRASVEWRRLHDRSRQAVCRGGPGQLEGVAHPGDRSGRGDRPGPPWRSAVPTGPDPTGHDQFPRASRRPPDRRQLHHVAVARAGQAGTARTSSRLPDR
jgi:ABC-type Na+ transport system ATPase subunit NatA